MKIGKKLLAFLFTGVVWGGALHAGEVSIVYIGPGLSNNIPKDTVGTLYMGVASNSTIDVHNPVTHQHPAFTYTYEPTATTIGPVQFAVGPQGERLDLKSCSSSLNNGKISITTEGFGGKQKTLKKLIVHLHTTTKEGSDKETVFFTNSCFVEDKYE